MAMVKGSVCIYVRYLPTFLVSLLGEGERRPKRVGRDLKGGKEEEKGTHESSIFIPQRKVLQRGMAFEELHHNRLD